MMSYSRTRACAIYDCEFGGIGGICGIAVGRAHNALMESGNPIAELMGQPLPSAADPWVQPLGVVLARVIKQQVYRLLDESMNPNCGVLIICARLIVLTRHALVDRRSWPQRSVRRRALMLVKILDYRPPQYYIGQRRRLGAGDLAA